MTRRLSLESEWALGECIGQGGFGSVLEASSDEVPNAVAKLIPKEPGAEREMLFVDLDGARNIVPIIDSGEAEDSWVLIMPRATKSLRDHIESFKGRVPLHEALAVLANIATALSDLQDKRVVHRDLKPENVLLLDRCWCLADFGISRYAEASTAPDTRKYMMTYPYAAPEQWRGERATSATDVYALGVIGYEMLAGHLPFPGPLRHDFRDQHLHEDAESLAGVPLPIVALIDECLYKGPQARPTPANLLARLAQATEATASTGLARLQQANLDEVSRIKEQARKASEARSEGERRKELAQSANRALTTMMDYLKNAILANAPTADFRLRGNDGWEIALNQARLQFRNPMFLELPPWGPQSGPPIDVIASAGLGVFAPANQWGYEGRCHSVWYCDAQTSGEYRWYETAFMDTPVTRHVDRGIEPYALDPNSGSAEAIGPGLTMVQVAWPFTPLSIGVINEFVDRWAGWFAAASQGKLLRPTLMPEKRVQGSWRDR